MNNNVQVGQVWADNDPRATGRTLRVERVYQDMGKASCVILTPRKDGISEGVHERRVRISLKRFRPTSNGYRLLKDVPAARAERVYAVLSQRQQSRTSLENVADVLEALERLEGAG